ncbi:unnamed protein product [Mytilus coruscus]|uniref:B box-type domain-containing protein n=1 Tax=Mytilus coruscus TaxID=42192 RepID=A0A6J8E4A8_MYTCO|nr:unnamed protein product [Mytilus coruscus]
MATSTPICAICDQRHVTSSSIHWCPECKESVCSNCSEHHSLSKGTRSHKTIPITQYQSLPTFVTDIQQFCIYHNEQYQQYCMTHESPICYKCIKEHGKCSEVIPLEDVIGAIKRSELFRDLEQSVEDVFENIKRIREDREKNVQSIQTQKKNITMEIDSIKKRINQYLDKLKDSVIKELEEVYDDYYGHFQSIISSLKIQEHEIKNCSMEFENITKYSSHLQTFLGMRKIQSQMTDNESRLQSIIANKCLENADIVFTINEKLSDILKSIKAFGSITVETSPFACAKISSKKTRQAQISAPNRMHLINTISIELNRKFKTIYGCPRGCAMTQNGLYIFPDSSGSRIAAINAQVGGTGLATGSFLQLLPIPPLTLGVPMVAMAMMTMMSTVNSGTTVTSVAPTIVPVTVPTTQAQAAVQTSKYTECAMTPGAYLWRPNSNAESLAVFNKFKIIPTTNIWTGANSPGHDGNVVFAVDNGAFDYTNVPFGTSKFYLLS